MTDVCTMCVCWVCIHSVIACWPAFHSKPRASSHRWRWLVQLTAVTHRSYPQIFLQNAKVSNCRWRYFKVPKCTLAGHRLDLHHPWWHQSIQLTACKHWQNIKTRMKKLLFNSISKFHFYSFFFYLNVDMSKSVLKHAMHFICIKLKGQRATVVLIFPCPPAY